MVRQAGRQPRLAHRDLIAVVAASSVSGAPASAIEAVATRLAMASGQPAVGRSSGTGPEPRWAAEDVIRVVDHAIEVVHEASSMAWEGRETGRGQDRSRALGVDRTHGLSEERGPSQEHGLSQELGR